jgi:hypothetical protein
MIEVILWLFVAFMVKHFVVDFPLQGPYQWMNKGTYGHLGGILHAGLHGLATFLILVLVTNAPLPSLLLASADFLIHYHVDWAKMNINKKFGWKADTHPEFWILLGLDQLAHMLTYVAIIAMVVL